MTDDRLSELRVLKLHQFFETLLLLVRHVAVEVLRPNRPLASAPPCGQTSKSQIRDFGRSRFALGLLRLRQRAPTIWFSLEFNLRKSWVWRCRRYRLPRMPQLTAVPPLAVLGRD